MRQPGNGKRADYGIDAPGIRRGMFAVFGIGTVVGAASFANTLAVAVPAPLVRVLRSLGITAALYGGWMGSYMTWSSKVGKLRTRDTLLDRAERLRPWRGDEIVADIGCGRGLMVVGAAKRLTTGIATGIDVWREADQAQNSPEAALENARLEGVADRVRIVTGDARDLPLADGSVDVVLSHWVVHNLESAEDRAKAIDEMWRVLRPGGTLVVADIEHVASYRQRLVERGAGSIQFFDGGFETSAMRLLSGGTFAPQAVLSVKPEGAAC